MNMSIICVLFFAFLVSVIPTSFAEEENEIFNWQRSSMEDSDYFIHFQAQVRDIDGSFVSMVETFSGEYLSDSRTELVYSSLPLMKVVEITNEKYEMKQLEQIEKDFGKFGMQQWLDQTSGYTAGAYNVGYFHDGMYTAVFHAYPPVIIVEDNDIVTIQWTIFKKI